VSVEGGLEAGEVVAGKYSILDTLGVGASGTVFRAQRAGMTQLVALKLMHAEHAVDDAERQRFGREAEMLKKLEHPNVVRLLDYGHTDDGVPFLVFPLLEGRSLEDRMKAEGRFAWDETGKLSLQILRALERAHALDIVHRDIKPANIFLSSGVLGEVVQMLDFGLAKLSGTTGFDVTRAGMVLGTPRYMAPEQVRGEQVGPCADIYSVGLVLGEMLAGRPLVAGKDEMAIYVQQGSDRALVLPDEVLSSPFATVVQRAVAKPLEVRYRLASQMLADLHAIVERAGIAAAPQEADMDATQMIDPSLALRLSRPTATSEKLRTAFNAIAAKQAPAAMPPVPVPVPVPEPPISTPLPLSYRAPVSTPIPLPPQGGAPAWGAATQVYAPASAQPMPPPGATYPPVSGTVPYIPGPDSGPPLDRPLSLPKARRSSHRALVVALVVVLLLIGGGLAFAWHLLRHPTTPRSSTYAGGSALESSTTDRNRGAPAYSRCASNASMSTAPIPAASAPTTSTSGMSPA
jgi:eukaryotic-like serine/threonine-protein kinase